MNWEKVAKRITSLVQKDRYLTEQEQAQYDKIQSEQELAEEDAIPVSYTHLKTTNGGLPRKNSRPRLWCLHC